MEAPGIRHSKKCNARQSANAELSVPVDPADTVSDESKKEAVLVVRPADDDFEMTVDSEAVLNRPDLKRTSDVPVDRRTCCHRSKTDWSQQNRQALMDEGS